MAREGAAASLISLPLEVRYSIFAHLSAHRSKPRKLLWHRFERVDVECLVHHSKWQDPSRPAPIVVYDDDDDDDCDTERESVLNENHEEKTATNMGSKKSRTLRAKTARTLTMLTKTKRATKTTRARQLEVMSISLIDTPYGSIGIGGIFHTCCA